MCPWFLAHGVISVVAHYGQQRSERSLGKVSQMPGKHTSLASPHSPIPLMTPPPQKSILCTARCAGIRQGRTTLSVWWKPRFSLAVIHDGSTVHFDSVACHIRRSTVAPLGWRRRTHEVGTAEIHNAAGWQLFSTEQYLLSVRLVKQFHCRS